MRSSWGPSRVRRDHVRGAGIDVRARRAARPEDMRAFRGTLSVFLMTGAGCFKAAIGRPARPPRRLGFGLTILALVACAPQRMTVVPDALQGLAPFCAQVDPHLLTLTERWVTGGTAGEVPVGDLLSQVLVNEPQASLRLMYVTSQLDVATIVSPTFYRPRAYQARYQLTVRVESPAIGVRQSWLHTVGESRTLASAARATNDAITQAVREFYGQLAAVQNVRAPREIGSDHTPR